MSVFADPGALANATPIRLIAAADWPGVLEAAPEPRRTLAAAFDFRAQAGRSLLIQEGGGLAEVWLGLGERPAAMAIGALAKDLPTGAYRLHTAPEALDRTLLATAWALGAYQFDRYKPRKRPPPRLVPPQGADMGEAQRLAAAVGLVRDLVNTPADDMGPEALHAQAEILADRFGARFSAIVGEGLLDENYPMIHAVGRAAREAPRLLRLSWGAADAPRLALVGKGVTFDSGGLDLKAAAGMRLMKKDMGGAAHALALAQLIMDAGLKLQVDLWLPVVENAIGPAAFRPGDILRSRKGLSVEIDNTDAEGRLILADALSRACEENPALVIDFATLTGAARTALGPDLAPLYTTDDAFAAAVLEAGRAQEDPVWRMPLWDGYDQDLDSPIADLVNGPSHAFAGSIIAALFLRRFVGAKAWAHFDVYAWSPKDRPGKPQGGEAQGLRASFTALKAWATS